eukprot:6548802-Heterocapsa_arctica.AAC.1
MQHVAEVVAGTDVVSIKPTKSAGSGTGPPGRTSAAKVTKVPPPRGGAPQNIGAHESTGPPGGTERATPALRRDATQKMIESDRVATLAVLKGIPHGTNIDFNLTDSFSDEKFVHCGTILDTMIGDYLGNTEVVLGIVSLGP